MIIGFEDITEPLTDTEKELLPEFVDRLKLRVGKDNAVTSRQIIEGYLKKKVPVKITGPRIRKIINYIRMNGLVPKLVATSAGYYIATHKHELESYAKSLMGRELAIREIRKRIEQETQTL